MADVTVVVTRDVKHGEKWYHAGDSLSVDEETAQHLLDTSAARRPESEATAATRPMAGIGNAAGAANMTGPGGALPGDETKARQP